MSRKLPKGKPISYLKQPPAFYEKTSPEYVAPFDTLEHTHKPEEVVNYINNISPEVLVDKLELWGAVFPSIAKLREEITWREEGGIIQYYVGEGDLRDPVGQPTHSLEELKEKYLGSSE